ncbi:glycosyltransferase family 4 protein [Enterobacteriaceae bacterium 4M9]|nr:glycosyltransferase family 4 protein [Enterobacteriaceae bacterium 4M9]
MKLALIIDDYLPYSTRVGAKMFHELALELVSRGHSITVITPDFGLNKSFERSFLEGVEVWRFKSGPIKDVGKIVRAINESLLSLRGWHAIKKHVNDNTFDGIAYYSPSIFWGGLVRRIKKRCQCPSYLVLRDMFPQWVIDAGMLHADSFFAKYFRFFENYSYNQADRIGVMSERNLEIFQRDRSNMPGEVLRNWASLKPVAQDEKFSSIRVKLGLQGKIVYFYGGNIGHAQDMTNLMRLVRGMQSCSNAHFLFVGQGDEVTLINKLAQEWSLTNFSYIPSVDQQEFKKILAEVDIGLFSLSANHTAHNFPGKLLGYMVQSLPILGSVNYGNDLLDIVNGNNAGFIHVNGDDSGLLQSAQRLYENNALRIKVGQCSYRLLEEQFSVQSAADIIESALEKKNAPDKTAENAAAIG